MKNVQITIPDDGNCHYLGYYQKLIEDYIGSVGSCVLNKRVCGCGATSMFLHDNNPTVLCSPRTELLLCKFKGENSRISNVWLNGGVSFEQLYLFRMESDIDSSPMELKDRLRNYVEACHSNKIVPKILVTYDSAKHVIETLRGMGVIGSFRFIVDEAQVMFTDAAFKGDVDMTFLENMKPVRNVVYLSATPYMKEYMEKIEPFKRLTYFELVWPERYLHYVNIERKKYISGSIMRTALRIIEDYRKTGSFADKIVSGNPVHACQGIFFLNNVTQIVRIIKKAHIQPHEVDIICADTQENLDKIKTLGKGYSIGHARQKGEAHRTFTFVTKCAFEGVDFYHPSGFTFIFTSTRMETLALDISLDLPQIMGRQRLDDNPFRYDAVFYYANKPDFNPTRKAEFDKWINEKAMLTAKTVSQLRSVSDAKVKNRLLDVYRKVQTNEKMTEDYVTIVDDKATGRAKPVFNELAMYNEIRSWQVQQEQYLNDCVVMSSIDAATHHVAKDPEIGRFLSALDSLSGIREMTRLYCETLCQNPKFQEILESLHQVPIEIKEAFIKYGPDTLRNNGYAIPSTGANTEIPPEIQRKANTLFKPGLFYTNEQVKEGLQTIYDGYFGPGVRTAKASDIKDIVSCKTFRGRVESVRRYGYVIDG